MDLPTFAATPSFFDFDPIKPNRSQTTSSTAEQTDPPWKSTDPLIRAHSPSRVSYYFPKGVGDYHFGGIP